MRALLMFSMFGLLVGACGDGGGGGGTATSGDGDGDGDGDNDVVLRIEDHEHVLAEGEGGEQLFYFEVLSADASYEVDRLTLFVKSGPGSAFGTRILLDDDDGVLDADDTGIAVEEADRFGPEHAGSNLEVRLVVDQATAEPRDLFEGSWPAE